MKKRFFTLLSMTLLLAGSVVTQAQIQHPTDFTIEQQAKIDSLVQTYLQKGFTREMVQERVESIVRNESNISTRSRLAVPPTHSIWVNRDPDNPVNPHPVYDTATPEDLIKQVLLSDPLAQSRITNVVFSGTTGANRSLAFFENGHKLGIPSGLILGTYDVQDAEGPNPNGGNISGGTNMLTGDPHLTPIATSSVEDGSILQFDFQPYAETVSFDFIFASEEYPQYSNSSFNDVFGFFVWETTTPGVYENIALFPNGDPVTINNSNWGQIGDAGNTPAGLPSPLGDAVNPQWHVPNYNDVAGSDSIMEFSGRTIKLKARALSLDTTKTYTLKLAIANVSDQAWGSAVFLANLDLGTPSGNIETDFDKDGGEGWNTSWDDAAIARNDFYAGCTQKITFDVIKHLSQDRNMRFEFKPESMRDYMLVNGKSFPDTVFIAKGSDTPVVMNFTVGEIPKEMEGVGFSIETYYEEMNGTPSPGRDTTLLTFYNHPTFDIQYIKPSQGYSGKLEVNISGGTPYLMRSLDKGKSWYLASDPISKSEIYNLQDEDESYLWLKEPNSCWEQVIRLGEANEPSPIMRPVTMPTIANAIVSVEPGTKYVPSRGSFSFKIQPTGLNAGKVPVITTGRTTIPDSEGVVVEDLGNGVFRVTILGIQEPINISVDFTTGNELVDDDNNVWTNGGQLYITTTVSGNAAIYNATGTLVKTISMVAGETVSTSLPAGFYIVTVNGKSYKVISK